MNARTSELLPSSRSGPRLRLLRLLLAVAGTTYLSWWFSVEWFLPGSFNPFASRMAVVALLWGILLASYLSTAVVRALPQLFLAGIAVLTAHYFYLLYFNQADIDWVVGAYVTVIATGACLQRQRDYAIYSGWVALLSLAIALADPRLLKTIFLPGMATVLGIGYLGLRSRVRLIEGSLEAAQWFQDLFDAAFEALVVYEDGLVRDANDAFLVTFGYRHDEVIGQPLVRFVAPEFALLLLDRLERSEGARTEVTGVRKDGTRIILEMRGKTHRLHGRVVRLAAMSDVTARRTSEQNRVLYEASQAALAMRDEFLSIASHELRTPLTNLKIQAQMVQRAMKRGTPILSDPLRLQKFLEQTNRQVDRLSRLVEEMLDVSRLSSGALPLHWERFDWVELVRDVAATFAPALAEVGSVLQWSVTGPVVVRADRFRLDQVVSNLLSNAIKYGRGKPISLSLANQGNEVVMRIEDHGVGIAVGEQQRIFERFERGSAVGSASGVGLGLYISKYIVEALGGRIDVVSRAGEGSCFTVAFPKPE